jgi:hypothetical protein
MALNFRNEKEFQTWLDSIKRNQSTDEGYNPLQHIPKKESNRKRTQKYMYFDSETKTYNIGSEREIKYKEFPVEKLTLVFVALSVICVCLYYIL